MEFQVVDKESFTVTGKMRGVSSKDGSNLVDIPAFWQECHRDGSTMKLEVMGEGGDLLGICMEFDGQGGFQYLIGVKTDANRQQAAGFETRSIPAASWAVFTSIGPLPAAIQQVWQYVYQDWFPASGYEHAPGPELEVYPPGDTMSDDYRCEVWIPVVKR
ncbi:AraC family transcriptional regulator [Paenibacillus sp. HJL G12]|uniref:AraC family transcriptional regulator n=1 Tax=Paenibacillus dendrobii TaxID=2691084 RepID=A0A7X3LJL7_9BACL|nr:GyrI-like domain-containing protein [Paenibacillus dendrobii]MWV46400.1 AraC family transcriptional regulator [Paenibacillus dendrobii]